MSTEQPQYSRTEISDEAKRKKTAEEIKATNSGVDKKKTPEGKKELSQTWIQKANLTPAQKQALCDELLIKDIDSEDPKELERRVIALQKHLDFPAKDCDGILGWKTLEKTDKMIEEQHKAGEEETGEKDESEAYGLDRVAYEEKRKKEKAEKPAQLKKQLVEGQTEGLTDVNGMRLEVEDGENGEKLLRGTGENSDKYYNIDSGTYETKDEKVSRIASEKLKDPNSLASIKDGLLKSKSFDDGKKYAEAITAFLDDSDVADINKSLEEKKWAIEVTSDHGDYREYSLVDNEEVLKTQLADEKSETYKQKMREIFDEMKSKPDQYGETYGGTYDFNEQKLSLEGQEPNQYLTRTLNGQKQQYDNETETWEQIKEVNYNPKRLADISSIKGTPLPENEWTDIGKTLYFRTGERLIAIVPGGELREEVNGKWQNLDFSTLPKETQLAATNARIQYFDKTYGDYVDKELGAANDAKFRDIKLKSISRVDDTFTGNSQSQLEGGIVIKMVSSLLESKKSEAPYMGELTLGEYNQYRQNPDLFAQSDFLRKYNVKTRKQENAGFVDPEKYGIDSKGYEYARSGEDAFVKRPKTGASMDTIMIAGKDGKFESQRSWLQRVSVTPDTEYVVLGTDNLRFKKDKGGDLYVYKAGEKDKPLETYAKGKWEKTTGSV